MNIYQIIIGTEILNGRREDRHFPFLRDLLLQRGYRLKSSSIVEDDPELLERLFRLVKADPEGVLFSFGGIGATPDDYTRSVAAKVFGDGKLYEEREAKELIVAQFGERAYPHRVEMAKLPKGAQLLHNPVNRVPGFSLEGRYFFLPGFPEMAHPMVLEALDRYLPSTPPPPRYTICVEASENDLMEIMRRLPQEGIEFSSLPVIREGSYRDVISIAGKEARKWMEFFIEEVEKRGFRYREGEEC
ncbi:MAG: competence/damage-inducible protein A [Epsilonproteobacteria bacterium]|nr:molybdopterin-binding protein [Campylobacterota bacterium]NPA57277.1 competence/damage-inducible protein A [Campylobacterota bacterium]